jgi:hypothetical protein
MTVLITLDSSADFDEIDQRLEWGGARRKRPSTWKGLTSPTELHNEPF